MNWRASGAVFASAKSSASPCAPRKNSEPAPALLAAVLEPLIAETEEAALARLDDITLEELYARAVAQGFGEKQPTSDFEI